MPINNGKQLYTVQYLTHNYYGNTFPVLKVITDKYFSCLSISVSANQHADKLR